MQKGTPLALAFLFIVTSCTPLSQRIAEKLAIDTTGSLGCEHLQSRLFNHLDAILMDEQTFPEPLLVKTELTKRLTEILSERKPNSLNSKLVDGFVDSYMEFYLLATKSLPEALSAKNSSETTLAALVALELGDQTTPEKKQLQTELLTLRSALLSASEKLELDCEEPDKEPQHDPESESSNGPIFDYLRKKYPLPVYGGMKSLLVAYQSCDILNLSPMNSDTPQVEGISVVGRHPNGNGNVRKITSLKDVIETHYYIKDQRPPSESCANLQKFPLIYDYGGKPASSPSLHSSLDFFQNSGSGSSELGTDCSGFVFTAYAAAGLKLRSDQPLKALQVLGVSAGMLKEPQSNGLNCLSKKFGELIPGDLIASNGHVVMVDSVGTDPFGIAHYTKESECVMDSMNVSRFNFTISQSSPSKGAIGMNRMLAADYFATSPSMGSGLKDHAVTACLKKFGKRKSPSTSLISVVRHSGTLPCLSKPIPLTRQECLLSCNASNLDHLPF